MSIIINSSVCSALIRRNWTTSALRVSASLSERFHNRDGRIMTDGTMHDRRATGDCKIGFAGLILLPARRTVLPTSRLKGRPPLAAVHLRNYRIRMRQFHRPRTSRKKSAEIRASQFIWVIRFNVLAGWQTNRVVNGPSVRRVCTRMRTTGRSYTVDGVSSAERR